MAADPLDQVLRLVAEGRLTAEEAAPILAALEDGPAPSDEPAVQAGDAGQRPAGDRSAAGEAPPAGPPAGDAFQPASSLRIEVRDGGRDVVNLRLPLAVGRFALDRVPGLSGEQVDRVREAMVTGMRGPVLVVDDGDSGVRILLE